VLGHEGRISRGPAKSLRVINAEEHDVVYQLKKQDPTPMKYTAFNKTIVPQTVHRITNRRNASFVAEKPRSFQNNAIP
jgi:hypothetical protein